VKRVQSNQADNKGTIFLAVANPQIIAMAGIFRGGYPKTRHNGTIWGVYVTPAWRGLHIAEALLDACTAWARAQGLALVKLAVVNTNASAIRCYTRAGFSVYGVDPKVICYQGVYYDELLMVKAVQP
jgi:ribosomal protein S18 acetylase RimI-like enzyme